MNRGDIVFFNSTCSLVIEEKVLNKMTKYIQAKRDVPESGGVITGKVFKDKIEVVDCSVPGKYDKQSRCNFVRSKKGAQSFITIKFKKSGGQEVYLGEWHTHPEDFPRPSRTDIVDFDKSIKVNVINSENLFMIILGLKGIYLRFYNKKKFLVEYSLDYKFI